MSNKLSSAFNNVLSLTAFPVLWERPGVTPAPTIKVSSSNYSRNMEGPEEITMKGMEFVIAREQVADNAQFPLKRGDRLVDETGEYGVNTIKHIEILKGFKGEVVGYRVRTD